MEVGEEGWVGGWVGVPGGVDAGAGDVAPEAAPSRPRTPSSAESLRPNTFLLDLGREHTAPVNDHHRTG